MNKIYGEETKRFPRKKKKHLKKLHLKALKCHKNLLEAIERNPLGMSVLVDMMNGMSPVDALNKILLT